MNFHDTRTTFHNLLLLSNLSEDHISIDDIGIDENSWIWEAKLKLLKGVFYLDALALHILVNFTERNKVLEGGDLSFMRQDREQGSSDLCWDLIGDMPKVANLSARL